MKTEYLIDTHIVVWLLNGDTKLNDRIRNDIEYYQHPFHVSHASLLEMVQLKQLNKAVINKTFTEIKEELTRLNIVIDGLDIDSLERLEQIPFLTIQGDRHTDMIDRYLIAHAITHKYTMISADRKFPSYRPHGLVLVEN